MTSDNWVRRRASVLVVLLVVTAIGTGSGAALRADDGSTHASPSAPGATATYTVTVVAERGDAVTRSGLKEIGLNFNADPDFSGNLANVTARDVTVQVEGRNGETSRVGPVRVAANSTTGKVWIGLRSAYTRIEPGDEIVVKIADVTNTEIAIADPEGLRGFALNVSVANPQGQVDGPVETRYTIDPNAQVTETTRVSSNGTASNETNQSGTATTGTSEGTTAGTGTSGSGAEASPTGTTGDQSEANATGTETTGASGSGFGVGVALVALLAIALLALRQQ